MGSGDLQPVWTNRDAGSHLTMLDSTDQRLPIHAARPARLRELSPLELRCLDIDVELRDVWALLDQLPGRWKKRRLQFFAEALRVSYDRGLSAGKLAGFDEGFEEGHELGYAEGTEEADALKPQSWMTPNPQTPRTGAGS
jgi:hypothetical protein